jgi:hypothetical protein
MGGGRLGDRKIAKSLICVSHMPVVLPADQMAGSPALRRVQPVAHATIQPCVGPMSSQWRQGHVVARSQSGEGPCPR